jgi:hypothetical protein
LAAAQAKRAKAESFLVPPTAPAPKAGSAGIAALGIIPIKPPVVPASKNLAEPYYQQINESYCGPATFAMVADYKHVGWAGTAAQKQQDAAKLLGTTMNDGTVVVALGGRGYIS